MVATAGSGIGGVGGCGSWALPLSRSSSTIPVPDCTTDTAGSGVGSVGGAVMAAQGAVA
jgi:hypothetical protein